MEKVKMSFTDRVRIIFRTPVQDQVGHVQLEI